MISTYNVKNIEIDKNNFTDHHQIGFSSITETSNVIFKDFVCENSEL